MVHSEGSLGASLKRSASKGKIGKINNKKKKLLKRMKSKNTNDGFTLSAPQGFKRVGHIGYDAETGEFTVSTNKPLFNIEK